MKPTMQNLKNLASKWGATVEIDGVSELSKTIQVVAPDEKQWVDSGSVHLVAEYWLRTQGSKEEALQDLMNRIQYGLEELQEENA